jgi:L-ascorbate metabolism protein UlaG (beta-lactamase superfamily)
MWVEKAKKAAFISAAIVATIAIIIVLLWQDRSSLDAIDWPPPAAASAAATDSVTVTWLGVTTLLFDDGETQILIDGFFSRPSLTDILLGRPVDNDAAGIDYVLNEFRIRRLAAIIPLHSHFDHAMDVGAIANRSSASILGSESTAQVARGAGVPEDQITVITGEQTFQFGDFTVTLLPSVHAPIGWRGTIPLSGIIEEPLLMPPPIDAWREGGSFSVVVAHPQGTILVHGSAGYSEGALQAVTADVVMLGVAGLRSLGKKYAERYWQNLVTATGGHSVYAIHFDDYTQPFGTVLLGPKFLDDFAKTAIWLEEFRDRWDADTSLFVPEFGKPIAILAQPATES